MKCFEGVWGEDVDLSVMTEVGSPLWGGRGEVKNRVICSRLVKEVAATVSCPRAVNYSPIH